MPQHQRVLRKRETAYSRPNLQPAEQEELLLKGGINKTDIEHPTPATVMQLQRAIGNQATKQLITQKSTSPTIQRNPIKEKLTSFITDLTKSDHIRILAHHILTAINAIDAGDWETARDLLYSKDVAGSLGHQLSVDMPTIDISKNPEGQFEKAIRNARYSFANKTIRVVDVSPYHPKWLDLSEGEYNDAEEKEKRDLYPHVLPVALEEWIHMFQNMTQSVLSEGTEMFMMSPQVQENQNLPVQWNMNEVDIYAVYKDLGWDIVLSEFKARYAERIKYQEFIDLLKRGTVSRRKRDK